MSIASQFSDPHPGAIVRRRSIRVGAATTLLVASTLVNILTIAIPMAALLIYDRVLPSGAVPTLGVLLLVVVVVIGIDTALRLARINILTRAGARIDHMLRDATMERVITQRFPGSGGMQLAHLTSALSAASVVREFRLTRLQLTVDLPFGLVFLLLIAAIGGWLVLIPAVACLLFALLAAGIASLNERASRALQGQEHRKQGFAGRIFDNLHTVKNLAAEMPLIDRYVRLQQGRSGKLRDQLFAGMLARDLYTMFSQVLVGCVVVAGALAVLGDQLSLGGLAACTLLAGRALEPLHTGFQFLMLGRQKRVAETEIAEIAGRNQDNEALAPVMAAGLWDEPPGVRVHGLSVRYPGMAEPMLDHVDLDVEPGEVAAITADRGQGKTTFIRALLGMLPATGTIRFGGIAVNPTTADGIRRNITYLARDPDLPSGRLIDALTDGDENSYADVRYLSHLVGLDEAIKRLPDGYDTTVGPDANFLPAGIRQQSAIVRGLAKKQKLIVFDDTTFSLDASTEMRLAQLLKLLKGEATIILLTDRPVLRALADRRFVLSGGKIVLESIRRA